MARECCRCGINLNFFDKWFRATPKEIRIKNNEIRNNSIEIIYSLFHLPFFYFQSFLL
jgi:hypothetical protein